MKQSHKDKIRPVGKHFIPVSYSGTNLLLLPGLLFLIFTSSSFVHAGILNLPVYRAREVNTYFSIDSEVSIDYLVIAQENAENQPPVANAGTDQTLTDEDGDGLATVILDASESADADGSIESYNWAWNEGANTAAGMTASVTLPVGTTTIILTVTDDEGASDTDEVIITINEVAEENQPPTAADITDILTDEDTPVTITLDASDPDGDALVYAIVDEPGNGDISDFDNSTGMLIYTPNDDFSGEDSFTYQATDEDEAASNTATVSVTVNAVNAAPVADAGEDITVTDEDGDGVETVSLDASGSSDVDEDELSYAWDWNDGTTTGVNPDVILPVGAHTIILTVTDAEGASDTDEVIITVNEAEVIAPTFTVSPAEIILDEDFTETVTVTLTADEGTPEASYSLAPAAVDFASVSINADDGTVSITAVENQSGSQSFTITADAGEGNTATQTFSLTVNAVNDAPVITAQAAALTTAEQEALSIPLSALQVEDVDHTFPDDFTLQVLQGENYTVEGTTITPDEGFSGELLVTVQVSDGQASSNSFFLTVTVEAENQPPVANAGTDQTLTDEDGDGLATVILDASESADADEDELSYEWTWDNGGNASGVTVDVILPVGTHTITLTVTDTEGASDQDEVIITVNEAENQPPTAADISDILTDEDSPVTITLQASDADGDDLTYAVITQPANGTLSAVSGNTLTYTPAANFSGEDSFTYQASDDEAASNTATVSIDIAPLNDAPSFQISGNPAAIEENAGLQTINNFATDIDDGDPEAEQLLSFNITRTGGELTFAQEPAIDQNGTLTYEPATDATGSATFEVTLSDDGSAEGDNQNTSQPQSFTITVNEAEVIAPTFTVSPAEVVLEEDFTETVTVTLTADEGTPEASYSLAPAAVDFASVSINADDGTVSITAVENQFGSQSFTITADAGEGNTATQTFSLTVNAVNDAPVITAQAAALTTAEQEALSIPLSALQVEDVDHTFPDDFTLQVLQGENYTVEGTTITPDEGFTGELPVTVQVSDGQASSNAFTLTVNVEIVNTPPLPVALEDVVVPESTPAIAIDLRTAFTDEQDNPDALSYEMVSNSNESLFSNSDISAADILILTLVPGESGNAVITVKATDSGGLSAENEINIIVEQVNDPPVAIDIPDQTLEEDGEGISIDLTAFFSDDEDEVTQLLFTVNDNNNPDLTTANVADEVLTITPLENAHGTALITIEAEDTGGETVETVVTIIVNPVNDLSVLSNIEAEPVGFNEGDPAKFITQAIAIADIDDTELQGAEVKFLQEGNAAFFAGEDILQYTTPGNINANWNPNTGVLTFTGNSSLTNYQAALRSVKYFNTKTTNPTQGLREISFTVNDGDDTSEAVTRFIAVANPDLPPILANLNIEIQEDIAYTFNREDFENNYNDPDDKPFNGIYIQSLPLKGSLIYSGNTIEAADILNAPKVIGRFAGFFIDAANIGNLVYLPFQDFIGNESFKWNAFDGNSLAANPASVFITVNPFNDPPFIQSPSSVIVPEGSPYTFANIIITDPDAGDANLRVKFAVNQGLLSFTNPNVLQQLSFIQGDGTEDNTMEFEAGQDDINNALESLSYTSGADFTGSDILAVQVSDQGATGMGGAQTSETQISIFVNDVNNIPVLENIEEDPLQYIPSQGAVPITSTLTISDADNDNLNGATITIAQSFTPSEDVLNFTDTDKITGKRADNRLILTGAASIAEYQVALRSVTYENIAENPTPATRTVSFQVSDINNGFSSEMSRNIEINNGLALTNLERDILSYAVGGVPQRLSNSITIANSDNTVITSAVIFFSADSYQPGEDALFLESDLVESITWDETTGTLTLRGNHSAEEYTLALRAVFYTNLKDPDVTPGNRQVNFQVFAEDTESNIASREIQLIRNQKPLISSFDKSMIKGGELIFSPSDFGSHFTDDDNMPNNGNLYSIKIITLPLHGILMYEDDTIVQEELDVLDGYVILADDITGLVYVPDQDFVGSDGFQWNGADGAEYADQVAEASISVRDFIVHAGDDIEVCEEEDESVRLEVTVSGGSGNYSYAWSCDQADCMLDNSDTQTIFVDPQTTTTYMVEVTDLEGNFKTSDTVVVQTTRCSNLALNIPSGITPNGDDSHDTWDIAYIETYESVQVQVFDRYGKRVFYSEGNYQPWDATFEGKTLPVGTYYYIINLNNGSTVHKGSLTILR